MYNIEKSPFGKFSQFRIENPETGNGFAIVPEIGGTVLDIWFNGRSILDGYQTPDELEEGKWGKCAILFPFPNRLCDGRYEWQGNTYTFPINNAATNNAIHGFVRHQAFDYEWGHSGENEASFTVAYTYDGHLAYYPFPFTLKLTFTISDEGTFRTAVEVINRHTGSIPVGFGWHPYFQLTEKVETCAMQIPACEKVAIDDRMLPTGATTTYTSFEQQQAIGDTFLDNCFLATADYQLHIEGDGRRLTLEASAQQFPYFQVFTPPHRTCVALEPMSCNVNAFQNQDGLVDLAPEKTWTGDFILQIA